MCSEVSSTKLDFPFILLSTFDLACDHAHQHIDDKNVIRQKLTIFSALNGKDDSSTYVQGVQSYNWAHLRLGSSNITSDHLPALLVLKYSNHHSNTKKA